MAKTKPLVLADTEEGPEEQAWVAVKDADNPIEAARVATREMPLGQGLNYFCGGAKSWQKFDRNPAWSYCQPEDAGAVEFWSLEVEERWEPLDTAPLKEAGLRRT